MNAYNKYGPYLKNKYNGQKVFKVIVDAGFTCPNRDGSKGFGGCTYCNVESFTPNLARSASDIKDQLRLGIERARKNYGAEKFIVYFQPNTNTYASVDQLKHLYDQALSINSPDIVGLSVGTRPDCISAEKIDLLESYSEKLDVDLEMGMESIYDETLKKINRGCLHEEFNAAVRMLKGRKIDLCVHTILGFPWETEEMMLAYAAEINRHPEIKFIKLHHLHIVEGSVMGVLYKREPFKLFTLEEYTLFLSKFIPLLRPDLVIQRAFGIADYDYLIAPNWNIGKSSIQTYIDRGLESRGVFQGQNYKYPVLS